MVKLAILRTLTVLLLPTMVLACANQPCRNVESEAVKVAKANAAAAELAKTQGSSSQRVPSQDGQGKTELVYLSDGSRQCQGPGTTLDEMAQKLVGIKIISQSKRHDGKIRTQNCGQMTGMLNVYEISKDDSEKALKLGFKKLNP